ncbi:low molecular weight protein-tyrosine-phosphatase [Caballeronia concitans]|uniref:protein-tyrosine-phosphatase n=1 Tax=Caballeronia concitans TaxID=1777133 RepID=A0A658QQ24_9BURK|nr:low molecular weight protein-tyrosine-phosphatase [Caballeronia concitans]KIG11469.1 protein tyrosine phosphatase [Burkholderia sp. MR1]SAL09135.1 protein tyrosine phosphatase [Caballeronia concitans]
MIRSVLMVCEGNVCRSPLAAALLAERSPHLEVMSAGTAALDGHSADPIAIDLMRERDIDVTGHIARTANLQLMRGSDLVLAMTRAQLDWLLSRYPFARGRVYLLLHEGAGDVVDPFRKSRACFEACLKQIETGVAEWSERLRADC